MAIPLRRRRCTGRSYGGSFDGRQAYSATAATGHRRRVACARCAAQRARRRGTSQRSRCCAPVNRAATRPRRGLQRPSPARDCGSIDGGLRAYAADGGEILWQFDTNRAYETVNGVPGTGASIDGSPLIVGGGMIFVNSGYGGIAARPGNVLLAFGVD